jgi:cytochrome b6-f complex iron-sulfur subunit
MLAGIAVTTLNSLYPRGVSGFGSKVFVGTVDELASGVPVRNSAAKAWLLKMDAEQAERNGGQEGAILALYQKCPHLGCTVPWRPDYSRDDPRIGEKYQGWFLCPCHGSTYSPAGVRVFGPAPRSMDTMAVTIDNGNITVDTGAITEGGEDNGSRGVLPA